MGKYADAGLIKYEALADPEGAAEKVISAWERAVREFGEQMRDNYVTNITDKATDPNTVIRMKEKLSSFYARLIPIIPEIRGAVAPAVQAHRMRRVRVLREFRR